MQVDEKLTSTKLQIPLIIDKFRLTGGNYIMVMWRKTEVLNYPNRPVLWINVRGVSSSIFLFTSLESSLLPYNKYWPANCSVGFLFGQMVVTSQKLQREHLVVECQIKDKATRSVPRPQCLLTEETVYLGRDWYQSARLLDYLYQHCAYACLLFMLYSNANR